MTVAAQVALVADGFELGDILTTEDSIEIELTQFVPINTQLIPYIWVEATNMNAFEASVREDSRVASLTRHDRRAEKTLYHVEWATELDGFLGLIADHDILVERGHGTAEEWVFLLRLSDHTSLRAFHSHCQEESLPLRVNWVSEGDIRTDPVDTPTPSTIDQQRSSESTRERTTPFRQIIENLDEVVWMTDPDKEEVLYANPAYEEVWGRPREELYEEPLSFLDPIHPDDRERVRAALELQPDGEYDEEYRLEQSDGGVRWIHDRAVSIRDDDGEVYRVAGIAEDITERKERERILTDLHDVTRTLFQADSSEEIANVAVQTAGKRLQLSLVSIYLFDESTGVLRPAAHTSDVTEIIGDLPTFTGSGSLAWEAFVTGGTRVYDDVRTEEIVYNAETSVRSELIVPLGDYGVFLAGTTTTGGFDDMEIEFAELLATNAVAALDHVEYERHLERQNERLVELSRLNGIIRSINQAVVNATTRDEIAAKVCENIVESDSYIAAWIGEYRTEREVTIHAAAGIMDAVEGEQIPVDDDSLMDELVGIAQQTRAVHVVQDVHGETNLDPWHEQLLDRGCHGAVTVPLTAGGAMYGLLTLYTDQPAAFDEEEVTILRELGQTIGRAIRAVEARRALVAETATELEFEITDANLFFVAASAELECRFTLEGLVPLEGGRLLFYVSVDRASPDVLLERATQAADIETCRLITETEEGGVFEFRMAGVSAVLALVDYSATIRSAVADCGNARVTAELPPNADTRSILNGLREVCPSTTLISKRDLDRPVQTGHQFREILAETLTEKQLNTLRSAYFSGYFEWPRASTAEDIAEPMDVASSTFHFHLRHALGKLLLAFFEARYTS